MEEVKRGINKGNLKKLFSMKWTTTEILITVMLIMIIFLAWSYNAETKECREWLNPLVSGDIDQCNLVCANKCDLFFYKPANESIEFLNESNIFIIK